MQLDITRLSKSMVVPRTASTTTAYPLQVRDHPALMLQVENHVCGKMATTSMILTWINMHIGLMTLTDEKLANQNNMILIDFDYILMFFTFQLFMERSEKFNCNFPQKH